MLIGAFIWDVDPIMLDLGFLQLRYYSILFTLGVIVVWFNVKKRLLYLGYLKDEVESLFLFMLIPMIMTSHLVHLAFYEPRSFIDNPIRIIQIGQGLASHGGLMGTACGIFLYKLWYKKKTIFFFQVADVVGIYSYLLGAMIRIGNFFNSEIIGEKTTMPWGVVFARRDEFLRHPSQLYEACFLFLLFIVSFFLFRKFADKTRPGIFAFSILTLYFLYRFIIELTRIPQEEFLMDIPLKMGQLLSIPAFFISLAVCIHLLFQSKKKT